jgi:asparagine synthetase B (glutamine-hydrolysing)
MARSGPVDADLYSSLAMLGDESAEAAEEALAAAAWCIAATDDPVNQVSLHELQGYLRDTLLRDVDAVSMRLGVEVRPVMLDTPLVELALSLPGRFKIRQDRHKAVLKDAFRDVLTPDVAARPKVGFQVPAREWTPRACVDLWMAAFDSPIASAMLTPEFRLRAQSAGSERRRATAAEWAAFVLVEVLRRHGLSS